MSWLTLHPPPGVEVLPGQPESALATKAPEFAAARIHLGRYEDVSTVRRLEGSERTPVVVLLGEFRRLLRPVPGISVYRLRDAVYRAVPVRVNGLRGERMAVRVKAAMERQPEVDQEVLTLRFLKQLSTWGVAPVIGISSDSVHKRTVRALRRCRETLKRDGT